MTETLKNASDQHRYQSGAFFIVESSIIFSSFSVFSPSTGDAKKAVPGTIIPRTALWLFIWH
ncbi:hypothetical protein QJ48_13265 [Paenibacillus sp. A3]|nr:hypothetical protein QJ48_13265 [Paenibacillus sp. A3]